MSNVQSFGSGVVECWSSALRKKVLLSNAIWEEIFYRSERRTPRGRRGEGVARFIPIYSFLVSFSPCCSRRCREFFELRIYCPSFLSYVGSGVRGRSP